MSYNNQTNDQLATYFMDKLGVRPTSTGWLRRGTCPSCEADGKFGVNIWLNRTNCFKCGYHPRPKDLVMKLEDLDSYNDFNNYIGTFDGTELLDRPVELIKQKFGNLPESYKLIGISDSRYGKMAEKYLKGRGFDITELMLKGVGYCTSGKYRGRIITPFYEDGKIVYFNARKFMDVGDKHKNPSMEDFGIGKSLLIYNVDSLKIYKRTYLVESATNALTLGDRAFALGGKTASQYQISKIIKSPTEEVVIILDLDAYWDSLKLALKLAPHKKVRVVKMPTKDDVNDYGKKKTLKVMKKSKILSYKEVYRLYINEPKPEHYLPSV